MVTGQMAGEATAKTRMTAAEYRHLPETGQRIELIRGEVVMSPSVVPDHQRVVIDLFRGEVSFASAVLDGKMIAVSRIFESV